MTEALRLHEVTHHIGLSYHMWSGFNMMASLKFWEQLPARMQQTVEAIARKHVAQQRAHTDALNRALEAKLAGWGMAVTTVDQGSFRRRLIDTGFYQRWRASTGERAWLLLEDSIGKIS